MSCHKFCKHPKLDVCRQKEALKLHETGRQSLIKLTIIIRYYHRDMPDRFDYVVEVRRFDDVVGKDDKSVIGKDEL